MDNFRRRTAEKGGFRLNSRYGDFSSNEGSKSTYGTWGGNKITYDYQGLSISGNESWVTVTTSNSGITIKCAKNTTFYDRTNVITVSYRGQTDTYTVRQDAATVKPQDDVVTAIVLDHTQGFSTSLYLNEDVQYDNFLVIQTTHPVVHLSNYEKTGLAFGYHVDDGTIVQDPGFTVSLRNKKLTVTSTRSNESTTSANTFVLILIFGDTCLNFEVIQLQKPAGQIGGYDYTTDTVGLKWCTKNIGASGVGKLGLGFQWGGTVGKQTTSFGTTDWDNYPHGTGQYNITKYNHIDNKYILDPEDDAAVVNMGNGWRMPLTSELKNIINYGWHVNNNGRHAKMNDNDDVMVFPFKDTNRWLVFSSHWYHQDSYNFWIAQKRNNLEEFVIDSQGGTFNPYRPDGTQYYGERDQGEAYTSDINDLDDEYINQHNYSDYTDIIDSTYRSEYFQVRAVHD